MPVSRSEEQGFKSPLTHRNFCYHNLITNVALGIFMTMRANKNLYSRHIRTLSPKKHFKILCKVFLCKILNPTKQALPRPPHRAGTWSWCGCGRRKLSACTSCSPPSSTMWAAEAPVAERLLPPPADATNYGFPADSTAALVFKNSI